MNSYPQVDNMQVKHLRAEIASVMKKIRSYTPRINYSSELAKASEVWEGYFDGHSIERVIIYLRSSGCFWAINTIKGKTEFKAGCLDCEHSVAGTTFGQPISPAAYVKQFVSEYSKYDFSMYPMLCLYNEGNFFNEKELPREARIDILKLIASEPNIKAVVLECLPEFITEKVLDETKNILGNKYVEIGIGLESADQLIRSVCVNKSFTLEKFESTAALVNRYFNLLAYILVKPSFLTEAEALQDAIDATRYAFNHGVQVVSLEPLNIGEHAMSGALSRLGLYRVPWLWTVVEVAKEAFKLGEIRVGGYQFAPRYENHAQNCEVCTMTVKDAIRKFNATNDIQYLSKLDCVCKSSWEAELSKKYPPLLERVETTLKQLEVAYPIAKPNITI